VAEEQYLDFRRSRSAASELRSNAQRQISAWFDDWVSTTKVSSIGLRLPPFAQFAWVAKFGGLNFGPA
jgi:hypothetical protein